MSLGYFRGSSFTILIHLAGSNFTVEIRVTLSKYRSSFFILKARQTDRTKSIWNTNNLRLFICPNESVENKESFEFLLNCGNYMGQARQLEEVEMEPSGAIECRMQVDCRGNRFRHWEEASILARIHRALSRLNGPQQQRTPKRRWRQQRSLEWISISS